MAKAKYTRGSDGYFQTKVWDGTYTKNGKKHLKNIRTKKSSKALEDMVNEFRSQVADRKITRKSDILFLDYAVEWIKVYKAQRASNTKSMYKRIINNHLIALEGIKLQDIERIHIQSVLNNASGKKRTQQQILLTSKQILRSAVIDQLFPGNAFESIFQNIESVNYSPIERRTLSQNERNAIFKADFNDSDRIFVYLLYGCGLRRGEALALTIFDINTKKRELTINKSHEFSTGSPVVKDPKSSNGYRTVPIPDRIFYDVEKYVESKRLNNDTYLFTMRNGQPVTKSSYNKMWKRIISKMQEVCEDQITDLTAHVFRHNYCTNLCYQIPSVSIKMIAKLLGDSDKMVIDVYNHIILEKEDVSSAVESAINF